VRSGEDEPILGRDLFERSRRDRAPYTLWRDQGLLIATGGNTTDFKFIEAEILALASRFVVTELAYDRTFVGEIVRNLQDEGLSLVEFGQGFLSMGPAAAEFLRLLIGLSFGL
jgi:phage terminase large subunit-like protein